MPATPNLSGLARTGYLAVGVILAAWGIFGASAGWARVMSLVIGGVLIVEGIIGFCVVARAFGKSSVPSGRT